MGRWDKKEKEMVKEAIKENDEILKAMDEVRQKKSEFRASLFGRMVADCKYAIQWGSFGQMYMPTVKGQIAVMRAIHDSLPAGTLTTTKEDIDTLESRLYAAEKFKTVKDAVPDNGDKMRFPARELIFYPKEGGTDCAEFYELENVNGEVYVNGDDGKSIPFDRINPQDQRRVMDELRPKFIETSRDRSKENQHHIPVQDEKTRQRQLIKEFGALTGYKVRMKDGKPFVNRNIVLSGVRIKEMPEDLVVNGDFVVVNSEILHGLPKGMVVYGNMKWENAHIPAPLPVDLFVEGKIEGIDDHALKYWKSRQEVQKQYDRVEQLGKDNPRAVEIMADHKSFPFVHDHPVMKFDRPVVLDSGHEYTHFVFAKDSDGTGSMRLHGANAPTVLRHINTFKDDEVDIILHELNDTINQAEYLGKKKKVVGDIIKPEVLRDMMKQEPWIKDYALQPRKTLTPGEKNKIADCFIGKMTAKGQYISDHTLMEVLNFVRTETIGDIIKERVCDSSAKAFTPEQYDTLEKGLQSYNSLFLDMSKDKDRAMILNKHWESCQKTFDKERIPAEWREDAKAELDGFASGIRREGEQLKR